MESHTIDVSSTQQSEIDSGIVHTVFKIDRSHFDRKKVQEALKELFKELQWDIDSCTRPAWVLIFEKKMFKCSEHQDVFTQTNKKMKEVWAMFDQEIKFLEQELVKLQVVISFMNSDGVKNEIDPDTDENKYME